jgi:Nucleotidyltransferase of unknown function (DUF6036)
MCAKALPQRWQDFLAEFDAMLKERLKLYCVGGFIFTYFYGAPRETSDIDYHTAVPATFNLDEVGGEDSPLHKKYKVCLHRSTVMTLPEGYEERSSEMMPGQFRYLRLFVPDPYDSILSKLERNDSKDRDDAKYLFQSQKLDTQTLRDRYETCHRPHIVSRVEWHDETLNLWIDIFTA